jgi:hypothetical protein
MSTVKHAHHSKITYLNIFIIYNKIKMMSWVKIVKKNIPQEIQEEIQKEEFQQSAAAKQREFERLESIMWNLFINTVKKEYGLKKPFDLHCDGKNILPRGEFWYFYVENMLNKKDDILKRYQWNYQIRTHIKNSIEFNDYIKELAENSKNRKQFKQYMYEMHGKNWLGDIHSEYPYDCSYIHELREQEYDREYDRQCHDESLEYAQKQADKKHEEEMKKKLAIGEITEAEYGREFNPDWEEEELTRKLISGEITRAEYSSWERDKLDEEASAEYRWEGECMAEYYAEQKYRELERIKELSRIERQKQRS